jgi:hypothetical protein
LAGCEEIPLDDAAGTTPVESVQASAQPLILDDSPYVVTTAAADRFVLAKGGKVASIVVAADDFPGVTRVAKLLQADLGRVTGATPTIVNTQPSSGSCIVVGTLGKSALIDQLASSGKLDVSDIKGKWEASILHVVSQPWTGVDSALVIVGSDKRGTIYGMFDLSEQSGVSPWTYWADVPAVSHSELYVMPGKRLLGPPAVKYRGIFINDENPALGGWASKTFGGFNSKFYDKLFELILRLRGNFLWPAMWGKSFDVDDPINPQLADEYGIVMGTSHHEPMMRNQAEWSGKGDWNYTTNQSALDTFWEGGIKRMGTRESIVTIGMRGDGDVAMSPNPDTALLKKIIANQRDIIVKVTGKDVTQVPQAWTLYKEVQDYYDLGLRAPDDVTTFLCDDNFGNIRKLPTLGAAIPKGGFGVYYHIDYHGGPRNYQWLNSNPLPRIWEQMHLAYEYGVKQVWILNVGDLKLNEAPTQFFLDYAWAPDKIPAQRLPDYSKQFAARQFGSDKADAIGRIMDTYAKFNARRKPELLAPETYSVVNYREAERVVADYNKLVADADAIRATLPKESVDAFDELVAWPVKASANLNELYVTTAKNRLYAKQGRAMTNTLADRVDQLFAKDAELTTTYNTKIAGGKWLHIADQIHIGYTGWDAPTKNTMPTVSRITVPAAASMGIAVEGSESFWPGGTGTATLPEFSPYQLQPAEYVEVFNRGQTSFQYKVESSASHVTVTPAQGTVETQQRVWVQVDWSKAPAGTSQVTLSFTGPNGSKVDVIAPLNNPAQKPAADTKLVETNGYVAMDGDQFSRKVDQDPIKWQVVPDLSRTGNAVTALPAASPDQTPGGNGPHLEYDVHFWRTGTFKVRMYFAPTRKFATGGLKYAVSFDDQAPQSVSLHADDGDGAWNTRLSDNVLSTSSSHTISTAGKHVLKFWMVSPAVVLQKIVIETGTVRASYLGPPTTCFSEPAIDSTPPTVACAVAPVGGAGGNAAGGNSGGGNGGSTPAAGAGGSPSGGSGGGAAGSGGTDGGGGWSGGGGRDHGGAAAGSSVTGGAKGGGSGSGGSTAPGTSDGASGCSCDVQGGSRPGSGLLFVLSLAVVSAAFPRRRN